MTTKDTGLRVEAPPQINLDPATLRLGQAVRGRASGVIFRVTQISPDRRDVRIQGPHTERWISMDLLASRYEEA